ncbi:MAG: Gfo/Idh/MocA family oxidoreductase [Sphingosinicella sp.]|nr:Gfo/Idh/MocA family oxidoreductase [Sphingosinicella sp.]
MTGKIRIGILGAGRIAVPAIITPARGHNDITVHCIAARDAERAEAFAHAHEIPFWAASYDAMLAREDIDLVYIGLPPMLHREWTERALRAGKAVLCEKPFALNTEEAEAMVAAAGRAGVPLIEAFHYRYHPLFRTLEALVADGAIGRVVSARAWLRYPIPEDAGEHRWSVAAGGGALMDLGCYPVHALRSLLGDAKVADARMAFERGVDRAVAARLSFASGVRATLHASMRTSAPSSGIILNGTSGRLMVRGFLMPHRGADAVLERSGTRTRLDVDPVTTFAAQLDHVVAVLRGEAQPLTGGADAAANMVLIDAIRAQARIRSAD